MIDYLEETMHQTQRYNELFTKSEAANLTKNEVKAHQILVEEHGLKTQFTSYYKDADDKNVSICTSFMMQRLIDKGLIKKVDKPRSSHEPITYEWV